MGALSGDFPGCAFPVSVILKNTATLSRRPYQASYRPGYFRPTVLLHLVREQAHQEIRRRGQARERDKACSPLE